MTDAQLADYVCEQTYNEEAGYYMTPEEAAQWEREWGAAEYEREIDELQQQLADARETIEILQAEAELAVDRANADAEASIEALQEQIDALQAQLEDAWNNA